MAIDNDIDRELRRLKNSSQPSINVDGFSNKNISEGDLKFTKDKTNLVLNKKHKGLLWQSKFYKDGNQVVDKNLTVKSNLTVKGSLLGNSYKIIAHNMLDDIGTNPVYLPWFGISEGADLTSQSSSFLVPYKMTLEKIMFRPTTITNTSHDLRVKLVKMDDGDTTVDTVATANYTNALASGTLFTVKRSDFDNIPRFGIGDNCGIEITAGGDYGGEIVWKITSVWEIKIL